MYIESYRCDHVITYAKHWMTIRMLVVSSFVCFTVVSFQYKSSMSSISIAILLQRVSDLWKSIRLQRID